MPRSTRSSTGGKPAVPTRGARATPPSSRGVKKQPMKPTATRRRGAVQQDFPVALKNIKTEVRVINKKFAPSGECEPLNNISHLVHAADGRSRHNLVDSKRPFRIPPHLLGRNLNDPMADAVAGCRRQMQKPRLGVRIPYRNLTSQIITHEELSRELLERSKKRNAELINAAPLTAEGNGFLFNTKVMARLSNSLSSSLSGGAAKVSSSGRQLYQRGVTRPGCSLDPTLERELALKQLRELPTKRKAGEPVRRDAEPKKLVKEEYQVPLTPKELALKQLAEIQTRKPKKKSDDKASPKFQVKINPPKVEKAKVNISALKVNIPKEPLKTYLPSKNLVLNKIILPLVPSATKSMANKGTGSPLNKNLTPLKSPPKIATAKATTLAKPVMATRSSKRVSKK